MSSSDNIKIALAAAYPGTNDKVWKRRSKTKVAGGTERVFENTLNGQTVTTLEAADGTVQVDGVTYKAGLSKAPVATPTAPAAAPVTASAPKAPKAAPAASTGLLTGNALRTALVPGSTWKVLEDIEVTRWKNGAYNRATGGHDQTLITVGKIAAGSEFVVAAKKMMSKYWSSGENEQSDGYLQPLAFKNASDLTVYPGGKEELRSWHDYKGDFFGYDRSVKPQVVDIPINQLEGKIEALEIPYTPVFVLRDSATGEMFGGWKTEPYTMERGHGYEPYRGTRSDVGNPKMVSKLSSAKKYATSSAAKASIREFTGYNEGLEEGDEGGAYYIMGGKKAMDLPPTWEMVEFDKVTGEEKRVIDVQNWLKSLNRLRVLTTTHGSAARAAYKKAEAHAEDFPVILIFQNRSVGFLTDYRGQRVSWDEKARFDDWRHGPAAMKAIDAAIKSISGKTLKAKSASAVAVSCQSLTDAIYAKMAFDFDSQDDQAIGITLLDFNTLEEIVETQA